MTATFHIQCTEDVMLKWFDEGWDHVMNVSKLVEAMQKSANSFNQNRWALIDDVRGWPVRTPEEITLSKQNLATMQNLGMTHCAVCVNDIALAKWIMQKIVAKGVKLAFFHSIEECKNWLTEQGFNPEFDAEDKRETTF